MNKTQFVLFMAVLCTIISVCWGQSYWKRTYGGTEDDQAFAITQTSDGNFIVAGCTESFGAGNSDIYLLKIKPNGDTLWTKSCAGPGWDNAYAITPTSDGNFIVVGNTADSLGIVYDYLLKIKPDGDILWTKTYGDEFGSANAITPASDGNFIIAGSNVNVYCLKIKPNGDTLWTKAYANTFTDEEVYAITPTLDGNFIVAGYSYFNNNGSDIWDIYLFKIKSNGDTLWTKTFGKNDNNVAHAITQTPDGNFIVAGYTESSENNNSYVYLLKITPQGDTLWTKTYGEDENSGAFTITPTRDGNFIVAGYADSYENGGVYLLKITPNGDTLWTKRYIGNNTEVFTMTRTPDGNFIAAGRSQDLENEDIWLLSIIDDRYAFKDSLFTFKIPVSGDSLNHGYTALKVPSGMTVSLGGTISWTPKTDSVYMDHVEFLIADDYGNKDTLTFNIFVNSSYHPTTIKPMSPSIAKNNQTFRISQASASQIKFSLPASASNIDIYDINGRCVQRLKPVEAHVVWNGLNTAGRPVSSGRYFAKIKDGANSRMAEFSVMK